jgi:hypothetical protein
MVFMLTLGRHSASSTYLREFWSAAFAPFPPQSFVDAKWYSDTFFTTFEYAGLFHVQGLAAALAVLGLIHWFQVDKTRGFAYLVTIAMLLVASGMRLYPFESRFLLGIIPGLFALTCVGLERVIEAPLRRPFESRILIFFLLFTTILSGIKHLGTPFEKEEVKPLIQEYLQLSRNGDILYVLRNAASQYRYYEQLFNLDDNGTIISNVRVANDLEYELELQSVPSGSSIWVLSSGMPARPRWRSENAAIRIISRTHELNKEYTATGAALFHYHHRSGHMSESQLIDP